MQWNLVKKLNIVLYPVLFITMVLLLFTLVSASVEHTASSDTTCNNGVCTKTLYSGVRNVFEDNQWKRVEEARSLKDKGFNVVLLEDDEKYPVEVTDFNYTSISVKLNPRGTVLFNRNVPLRIWNSNDTKAEDFNRDVSEGRRQSNGFKDYKEKMDRVLEEDISFNLLNQEEEMTLDFGMGKVLEFGFNSTTIILQDADTENLEDTMSKTGFPDNSYGDSSGLNVIATRTLVYKFNISEIVADSEVIEANFTLSNANTNSLDAGESLKITFHRIYPFPIYNISGSPWNENTYTHNTKPSEEEFNTTFVDSDIISNTYPALFEYVTYDITEIVSQSVGDSDVSILMNVSINSGSPSTSNEGIVFYSKETSTSSRRPKLTITYSDPAPETTYPSKISLKSGNLKLNDGRFTIRG